MPPEAPVMKTRRFFAIPLSLHRNRLSLAFCHCHGELHGVADGGVDIVVRDSQGNRPQIPVNEEIRALDVGKADHIEATIDAALLLITADGPATDCIHPLRDRLDRLAGATHVLLDDIEHVLPRHVPPADRVAVSAMIALDGTGKRLPHLAHCHHGRAALRPERFVLHFGNGFDEKDPHGAPAWLRAEDIGKLEHRDIEVAICEAHGSLLLLDAAPDVGVPLRKLHVRVRLCKIGKVAAANHDMLHTTPLRKRKKPLDRIDVELLVQVVDRCRSLDALVDTCREDESIAATEVFSQLIVRHFEVVAELDLHLRRKRGPFRQWWQRQRCHLMAASYELARRLASQKPRATDYEHLHGGPLTICPTL